VGHLLRLVKLFRLITVICRFHRCSSPSPPSVAQSISLLLLDLLRLDLAGASAPFSAPAVVSPSSHRLDGVCNPGVFSRCGVVLGRLAVSTVLLRCRRSSLDGGIATTTVAAPTVSLPWSSPSSSASSPVNPPPTPSVYAFKTWWPGQ
jgi:hypothetical protein